MQSKTIHTISTGDQIRQQLTILSNMLHHCSSNIPVISIFYTVEYVSEGIAYGSPWRHQPEEVIQSEYVQKPRSRYLVLPSSVICTSTQTWMAQSAQQVHLSE